MLSCTQTPKLSTAPNSSLNLLFFFVPEAANCFIRAVDIYTDMGRFNIAAKHHQTVAEIYENDVADLEKAMQHYEQAADFFRVRKKIQ